jgi:hypothetical protein
LQGISTVTGTFLKAVHSLEVSPLSEVNLTFSGGIKLKGLSQKIRYA